MHLIQILLPLYDNDGRHFDETLYEGVRGELTARFGGLTAFTRAPAQGLWQSGKGETTRDDIVVFEVMAEMIDAGWWAQYRAALERAFRQDTIVIRAQEVRIL